MSSMIATPDARRFQSTPLSGNASSRARKRKRLQHKTNANQFESPLTHKRRSSISDAALLSISGSYLDCTVTPDKDLFDGNINEKAKFIQILTVRYKILICLINFSRNKNNQRQRGKYQCQTSGFSRISSHGIKLR